MVSVTKRTSRLLRNIVLSALLFAFAVTALAGCNGADGTESSAAISQTDDSQASQAVSDSESSEATYEVSAESDASAEEGSEADNSADESTEHSEDSSLPEDESSEGEVSTEPEILGSGTKTDPYLMFPDENKSVTTYPIPAGESQYYSIYRVGGTVLTIESENASVTYDGMPYAAKKGKVEVSIAYALASDAILFEICNEGDSEESFLLQFENPVGTMANPKEITDIAKETSVSIPAGNETGYHFKHIAQKDGTLRFYMNASVASVLSVTNNATSANRTSEESEAEYVEIEVKKGDELVIVIGAQRDKRNNIPAVDVSWYAEYAE